jgi:hypothetical protein
MRVKMIVVATLSLRWLRCARHGIRCHGERSAAICLLPHAYGAMLFRLNLASMQAPPRITSLICRQPDRFWHIALRDSGLHELDSRGSPSDCARACRFAGS